MAHPGPHGLELWEALDDAATYLRNDGLVHLATAVERAAFMLGAPQTVEPERQVVPTEREPESPGEFGRGIDTLRQIAAMPRDAHGADPTWQNVADKALAMLADESLSPPSARALAVTWDALSILYAMRGTPGHVADLVAKTIAAMPRTRRRFGQGANLAPDDGGR